MSRPRRTVTVLYGGAFDPPHNGHVALACAARKRFAVGPLTILVAASPSHKRTHADPQARLLLARAAFPADEVELDEHGRTIDLLRERRYDDPTFLVGADEFCDFPTWKEPQRVLEAATLAVATRPGYPRERLEPVLRELRLPERVAFFELEPVPIASRDVRRRVARGEPIDDLVPAPVAALIGELGLYRQAA